MAEVHFSIYGFLHVSHYLKRGGKDYKWNLKYVRTHFYTQITSHVGEMTELPASANKTISAEQIGPWMFSLLLTVILSEPHEIQKIKN